MLTAHFLNALYESIPNPPEVALDPQRMGYVISALGYDPVFEDPVTVDGMLESIHMYLNSDLHQYVDIGRPAVVMHGGHVEGVTLPDNMMATFPAIEQGFVSKFILIIRSACEQAKEQGAVYFLLD